MIKTKTLLQIFIVIIFFISSVYGQSWQNYNSANSELQNDTINSVEISEDGTIWFATNDGLASLKDGVWNSFNTENGLDSKLNFISFLPNDSPNLWIATNFGVSIFNSNSNSELTDPQFITKSTDEIVSDTVTSFNLDGLFSKWIGTDKGLSVITTNSGVYNFTEANGLESSEVSALSVLPDDWVHIATKGGGISRLKYNGVDGISSASRIENSWSALPSDTVLTIYVTDDTLNWYGTAEGVGTFFGENSKTNNWWVYNTFSSGIIDNYVRAIVRDNIGNMWFGTKKGLSQLSADGNSWQSFTEEDGLISNNIYDIEVDKNNNLWIATDKGVSYLYDIQTSVENYKNEFNLYLTNYPNPFNPNTNIEYIIPKSTRVKLEVYDNIGKLVEVLVDKKLNSGNYNVSFNSKNLPSGVYFYRLITDQSSITKKMILLK